MCLPTCQPPRQTCQLNGCPLSLRRKCKEVKCRPSSFSDGYGQWLDRTNTCYNNYASVVVMVTDTCPCVFPDNYASNKRWCCGDMYHLDMSVWAYEKVGTGRHCICAADWWLAGMCSTLHAVIPGRQYLAAAKLLCGLVGLSVQCMHQHVLCSLVLCLIFKVCLRVLACMRDLICDSVSACRCTVCSLEASFGVFLV